MELEVKSVVRVTVTLNDATVRRCKDDGPVGEIAEAADTDGSVVVYVETPVDNKSESPLLAVLVVMA